MVILTTIMSLLSSNAIGSVIGWVGGLLGKKEDRRFEQMRLDDKQRDRAHDVVLRKIDIAIMDREIKGAERVAIIEKEGVVESAALEALSESYKHDASLQGGKFTETIRAAVRPILTFWGATIGTLQAGMIIYVAFMMYRVEFTDTQMFDLVQYCMQWVFFQSGLVIGWWFANRPSKAPTLPKLA